MQIKTGKQKSIGDLLEGREKMAKIDAVNASPMKVTGIVKGFSEKGEVFVYLLIEDDKFIAIPSANVDDFAEYADDREASEDFASGNYVVFYERHVSKNNREYFTCYVDRI